MNSEEIRKAFLTFFEERGHSIVPSSSLLPSDPSVLFTTAGMQQFKAYFTGNADPAKDFSSHRTASVQKCFRTSDIDEVGDETHLTFFQMLGNFSFGPVGADNPGDITKNGYFKKATIHWAWEFLSETLKLNTSKLYVTVFKGEEEISKDEESFGIWKELGFPEKKIFFSGRETNFWGPTGDEGPCGPTTEIHYDLRGVPCEKNEECIPNCECGRFVEFWNLVFNEYYQTKDKRLEKLFLQGVDTGMGLERLSFILQDRKTIFDTDLFLPLIFELRARIRREKSSGSSSFTQLYSPGMSMGEDFENARKEAEYERTFRIIADHIRASAFLLADGILPSNKEAGYILRRLIRKVLFIGYQYKIMDIEWGPGLLEKVVTRYGDFYPQLANGRERIRNEFREEAKRFYATLDTGLNMFNKFTAQKKEKGDPITVQEPQNIISGEDAFILFSTYGWPIELTQEVAMERDMGVDVAGFKKEFEKHQEVSRAGLERKFGGHGLLLDTGELKVTNEEELEKATRLHTATHLLHQVLRDVLGGHVKQMGSDITAERLRFDFTHPQKMTLEEIKKVEDFVNEKISEDLRVTMHDTLYEEAIKEGALAFFKLKYPSHVHVYSVGNYSKEVCGGPHVDHTGSMGHFRIIKEESSSAGVRRIRAILE